MAKNKLHVHAKTVHKIVVKLGEKVANRIKVEGQIIAAAKKGETTLALPINKNLTKEDACSLAIFLMSRGFLIQDVREELEAPRIVVCWY